MKINISETSMIKDVQEDFNRLYPFLKIEFYKPNTFLNGSTKHKHLLNNVDMKSAGLRMDVEIELNDSMSVGHLEKNFLNHCGLSVQVSRKSGTIWLETTMTDNWTLKQQNDHGKELSEPLIKSILSKDRYLDEN